MADWEDKLNAILANPQAMDQIASIARAFTGGEGAPETDSPTPPDPDTEPRTSKEPASDAPPPEELPDLSALLSLLKGAGGEGESPLAALGDLDPKLIQKALSLYTAYSAGDDRKVALLNALKPYLKEKRYARVDRAIQIAKLSRVIRAAFTLFRGGDEEGGEDRV
jgi:hypothetical protein